MDKENQAVNTLWTDILSPGDQTMIKNNQFSANSSIIRAQNVKLNQYNSQY